MPNMIERMMRAMAMSIPICTPVKEIARMLSDYAMWHSHGRGINMETLQNELGLKIEDFSSIPDLGEEVHKYFGLIKDYIRRQQIEPFIHTREFF